MLRQGEGCVPRGLENLWPDLPPTICSTILTPGSWVLTALGRPDAGVDTTLEALC